MKTPENRQPDRNWRTWLRPSRAQVVAVLGALVGGAFVSIWFMRWVSLNVPSAVITEDSLEDVLDRIEPANFVFEAPPSVSLDHTGYASLMLSPLATLEELKKRVRTELGPQFGQVSMGNWMRATLTTRDGRIDVEPIGEEDRSTHLDGETEWLWKIATVRPGRDELILNIAVQVQSEGRSGYRYLKAVFKGIEVTATPIEYGTHFWRDHWMWICGTAMPLAGGVLIFFLKRRENSAAVIANHQKRGRSGLAIVSRRGRRRS